MITLIMNYTAAQGFSMWVYMVPVVSVRYMNAEAIHLEQEMHCFPYECGFS